MDGVVKQTLFMIAATLVGTAGVLFVGPFAGVAVYYLFAVLRPQYLWKWALPMGVSWSQYVAAAALVGTVALLMGLLPLNREEAPFRRLSIVHKLCLAFGVWVCLTYFAAQNQEVAGFWLLEYAKLFLMFLVASIVIRRVAQVWVLYLVATLALAYIGYEVNSLYVFQRRMDIWHSGYGGLDNNGAGLMLAMGIPLAVYAWEGTRRWWRWGYAAAVPVLLHAVLMTYSRGAMLSLIVAAPVVLVRSRRRWQIAALALVLAAMIPVLAGKEIRARFFSLQTYEQDQSAQSRFGSWQAAFRIAREHPVMGVGIRNSALVSYQYGADMQGRVIHSQYLQVLADSGVPALALYLGTLGTAWLTLRRVRRRLRSRDDEQSNLARSIAAGLEGSLVVFCVGASFLSLEVFELPYLMILLAAQLGVLVEPEPAEAAAGEGVAGIEVTPAEARR